MVKQFSLYKIPKKFPKCYSSSNSSNSHQAQSGPMSLQIQIGGHVRSPPLRTSIGSTGSNSSGSSSIGHFNSMSPQDYLANPMFDSLNENRRTRRLHWPSNDKTISLKPLVVKRTRSLQRKLPPIKSGCRVIWMKNEKKKKIPASVMTVVEFHSEAGEYSIDFCIQMKISKGFFDM